MLPHAVVVHDADVAPMLGLAMFFLWVRLTGLCVREACTQLMLTIGGYFRPRPDPAAENALRTGFADLDRQLTALMDQRLPPARRTTDEAREPGAGHGRPPGP